MKARLFSVFAAAAGLLVLSGTMLAHHGAAGYDPNTKVTILKGTVTQFEWTNPHGQIHFDVKNDKGDVVSWISECGPPLRLVEVGWTRKTLKPGDVVTFHLRVAKNGAHTAILVKMVLADGTELENRA